MMEELELMKNKVIKNEKINSKEIVAIPINLK